MNALLKSTKVQSWIVLRSWEFKLTYLIVMFYACFAFLSVMSEGAGKDLISIKDANDSICYDSSSPYWILFAPLYPFLVILPCGASFIKDYRNGILSVYLPRSSRRIYYISKVISAFLCGGLAFLIPMLCNLLLCNIFLPHSHNLWIGGYRTEYSANLLLGNVDMYPVKYPRLPFLKLYLTSPFLYNLWYLVLFSLFSGLLGAGIVSFSFLMKKSKILLFVPVLAAMRILNTLDTALRNQAMNHGAVYTNLNLLDYITYRLYPKGGDPAFMVGVVAFLLLFIVFAIEVAVRSDLRDLQ